MSVHAERAPGAALLQPVALLSLVVFVVNDHVLKRACPGFITGKLSDFAGVLLLPLFLQALFELLCAALGRPRSARRSNVALGVAALATVLGFGWAELGGLGDAAFRHGLGALQWPFYALFSLLKGDGLPAVRAVQATADLTDLAALPMAGLAYVIGRRRPKSERAPRALRSLRVPLAGALSLAGLALASPAEAAPSAKYKHDGFFMSFELGTGVGFLDSTASISNGFEQSIPSSARGVAMPSGALQLGGTLRDPCLVLGARLGITQLKDPVVSTLGHRFQLSDASLQLFVIQGIAQWYPDPLRGTHFGVGIGGMSVELDSEFLGELQRGYSLSLEAGHDFWLAPQWSLALDGRLTAGRVSGEELGKTTVILPTISLGIVWH